MTEEQQRGADWLQRYLDYLAVERGLSVNTISAYRTDLHRLARYLGPRRGLDAARREDLLKALRRMRLQGRSPRSAAPRGRSA